MCLAIPAKIEKLLANNRAMANVGGVTREISVALIDDIKIDDYVIVHVGFALTKLDEQEATKTLKLFSEMQNQTL